MASPLNYGYLDRSRWPNESTVKLYNSLLTEFERQYKRLEQREADPKLRSDLAFERICRALQDRIQCQYLGLCLQRNPEDIDANVSEIDQICGALGMLMHFSPSVSDPDTLANDRRPTANHSSYPTPPEVGQIVAKHVLEVLEDFHYGATDISSTDAKKISEELLQTRILDPSMESGELLLQVATATLQIAHKCCPNLTTNGLHRLQRALLRRLCGYSLWGIDRSKRAKAAVNAVFALLGYTYGIANLRPKNLIVADSLSQFSNGEIGLFDAVINNPPWGEIGGTLTKEIVKTFELTEHQIEPYVAFSELAIKSLKPGGAYGLVLPSQVMGTRNSRNLRKFILDYGNLRSVIVLPRRAFADATVRGVILLGYAQQRRTAAQTVQFTYFPHTPLSSLTNAQPIYRSVKTKKLMSIHDKPWTVALHDQYERLSRIATIELGKVATVLSGVKPYHRARGKPPQTEEIVRTKPFTFEFQKKGTVPAIQGRQVLDYKLLAPRNFLKLGPWLAELGRHAELMHTQSIYVRELCRRDGKLNAALAQPGAVPLHGVLMVIPTIVDIYSIVAILNSRVTSEYVRWHTASFSKVDFQRITVGELKRLPVPTSLLSAASRRKLGLPSPKPSETGLRKKISDASRSIAVSEDESRKNIGKLRDSIESLISEAYGYV